MQSMVLTCSVLAGLMSAQLAVEEEPDHHAGFHNDRVYGLEPRFPPRAFRAYEVAPRSAPHTHPVQPSRC
jgi:hypothetical protein